MYRLKDGAFVSNIPRRRKTQSSNQPSAHIRKDVAVQIWHDEDLIVVRRRVRYNPQTRVVQELGIELYAGEILGHLPRNAQKQAIAHLHNGRLVYGSYLELPNIRCVLEGVAEDSLACLPGDELDGLHDPIHDHMLNA